MTSRPTARTAVLALLLCAADNAPASELEELARQGYGVVEQTEVDGEFEGCEHGRRIPLTNGLVFECSEYSYSYAYSPDVLIMQHVRTGDLKVLIDDEEYDGTLYKR